MREIVALGDLNLDLIFHALEGFPELGKEVLAGHHVMKPGGSCANTAIVLKRMGAQVSLYSEVGEDHIGDYILAELAKEGLATDTISRVSGKAAGITVALTYPIERSYITELGNLSTLSRRNLKTGYLRKGGHLHLASFFLQPAMRPEVGPLLQEARTAGMSTSLDPGHDPRGEWDLEALGPYWDSLDWFLPNAEEFRAIARAATLEEAFRSFRAEVKTVVVKNGAEGAVVRHHGEVSAYPALPTKVIDTSCAGDCFNAGFLFGVASDASVADAVKLGNACGAMAASCIGLPAAEACRSILSRRE